MLYLNLHRHHWQRRETVVAHASGQIGIQTGIRLK